MNLEMRWFFEGQLPEAVFEWCKGKGFKQEENPKERFHTYLLFPSDNLGVKTRDDQFQIKYRLYSGKFHSDLCQISGKIEMWGKSSLDLKDQSTNPFQDVKGPQTIVEKERYSRRFEVNLQTGVVTPSEKKVDHGIMMEVTKLSVEGKPFWTVDFDALGDRQKESLKIGVEEILKDYPGPSLKEENSFSYPEWLLRIHEKKTK